MGPAHPGYVTAPVGNVTGVDMTPSPRIGRPRDPTIDDQIVTATVALLGEHGYAGVSMEAIAAAAGVTKPTIYRRWSSKAVLAADALERRRSAMATPGDHGNLRDDLLAMVLDDHRALASESGVILGVAFAARADRDLDAAIGVRVDHDTHTRMQAVLDRAVARGELAPDTADSRFLLRTIASTLLGLMFRSAPDDTEFLTRLIDELIMPALVQAPADTAPGSPPGLDDQETFR